MSGRDLVGKRGESIAVTSLLDFCGRTLPYFDPHPLGEKCPTFDYLVELIDAGKTQPYFLAQVKATKKGTTKGTLQLKVEMKAKDVLMMTHCPVPTYLIGVDEPARIAYIVSIHGKLSGPVSSMPTKYPLNETTLPKLWTEVRDYWKTLNPLSKSSAFIF